VLLQKFSNYFHYFLLVHLMLWHLLCIHVEKRSRRGARISLSCFHLLRHQWWFLGFFLLICFFHHIASRNVCELPLFRIWKQNGVLFKCGFYLLQVSFLPAMFDFNRHLLCIGIVQGASLQHGTLIVSDWDFLSDLVLFLSFLSFLDVVSQLNAFLIE